MTYMYAVRTASGSWDVWSSRIGACTVPGASLEYAVTRMNGDTWW